MMIVSAPAHSRRASMSAVHCSCEYGGVSLLSPLPRASKTITRYVSASAPKPDFGSARDPRPRAPGCAIRPEAGPEHPSLVETNQGLGEHGIASAPKPRRLVDVQADAVALPVPQVLRQAGAADHVEAFSVHVAATAPCAQSGQPR